MVGLPEGIYETLRTARLDRQLSATPQLIPTIAEADEVEAPEIIARHVADVVRRHLAGIADTPERVRKTNQLLDLLNAHDHRVSGENVEQLLTLVSARPCARSVSRPTTPLSTAALLTNASDEPSLSAELRAELASADRVDLLCAFIRWHGIRVLEEPLSRLRDRGIPFRVITTTYVGATERRAIDELVNRFGAEVRISYETQSTRLHAKAWLFRRNSGFDTAFVGSSNLSRSALVDGLEWNVRLSGIATPELIRKFSATFDTYWASNSFVPYDPATGADKLDDALHLAGGRGSTSAPLRLGHLEVRPFPHQELILEALETERAAHDRHRNLVVAATGTGKTVVAALDYRRLLRETHAHNLSLLFVAHRREILDQSLHTYRETLADASFGEHYVGGSRPERWSHVFASIQSLSSYGVQNLPSDHFDVVVIDEFHHAEAATYRRLLDHLRPQELLGLTATPERADGVDVRSYFDDRSAYELPLWDALKADLLVPFHYFGVADDTDLRGIEWKRGGTYDVVGLDQLYTGNDARAAKVLRELHDKVTDVRRMRALGFCASVAHARYMARVFNAAGVPSLAVSGATRPSDRDDAITALRRGDVAVLFAADLFNEGLDIPEIDTVLFLRPTQSATVFLQQLGRGLRRAPGKAVLTVLDFIGQHRTEFRFDVRYRALTGATRRGIERQVERGFPFLPSGSQIVLDRVAEGIVLDNVRSQLRATKTQLMSEIRSHPDLSLASFLYEFDREVVEVYRNRGSWTALRRSAGCATPPAGPEDDALLKRMAYIAHVDDQERADAYTRLAGPGGPRYDDLTEREQRFARMLFFTLWPGGGGMRSYDEGLTRLRRHPAVCAEIQALVALSVDATRQLPASLGERLQHVPLASHARYRREEILAAFDYATLTRPPSNHQAGVAWAPDTSTDAFLITLHKSEKDFLPSTMYRDYAMSPELFHWESQNTTSIGSPTGQRYLNHGDQGTNVVLFVRDTPVDDLGAAPYVCLGAASYVDHRGEKPIAITWKLHRPMPADTFAVASVVA